MEGLGTLSNSFRICVAILQTFLHNTFLLFSLNEFHMCSPGELSPFPPKFTGIHDVRAGYEHGRGWQWRQ